MSTLRSTQGIQGSPRHNPHLHPHFVSASTPGLCLGSILALICNLPSCLLTSPRTAALFRSVSDESSALHYLARPRSPPVSEVRHQATTFKYLLSGLQRVRASGQLHWNKQTIKMPLPSQFDNTLEFTNDPHMLCHQASHLLRAISLVLAATWHVPLRPRHDCTQTSHHP